jgi:hypothetical protein
MSFLASTAIRIAELPPPPVPGGGAGDDVWWRIAGIVLVSLIAIVLFLYIFRPLTPTPAEGVDEQQREDEELARLAAQISAITEDPASGVIPFRSRAQPPGSAGQSDVSQAQARLRRILGQSAHGEPVDHSERRRLGGRRADPPAVADRPTDAGESVASRPGPETPAARSMKQASQIRMVEEEKGKLAPTAQDDIWGDLGEIAHRLPSEADRKAVESESGDVEPDLLGDLVNRRPSDEDQVPGAESAAPTPAAASNGKAPTERDIERLAEEARATGKIVPFVRRTHDRAGAPDQTTPTDIDEAYRLLDEIGPAPAPAPVMPITVDAQTREAIEAVIRQLLFYANVGEVLQGFGLYTDEHLRRFMAESGMPEEEFQALFAAIPPKRPVEWTRIEFISRVVRMQDGRISADVQYVDGHQPNGKERLTFVQDTSTRRWLIDDIEAI